jgi:hypothetical protein
MQLFELYRCAHRENIPIFMRPMPLCGSMSVMVDGKCAIGLDRSVCDCSSREKTHLAHEIGHCITGSFYSALTPQNIRERQENRADKYAIRLLVPKDVLESAVAAGLTQVWELADYFGVTEEFMSKAITLYQTGSLPAQA